MSTMQDPDLETTSNALTSYSPLRLQAAAPVFVGALARKHSLEVATFSRALGTGHSEREHGRFPRRNRRQRSLLTNGYEYKLDVRASDRIPTPPVVLAERVEKADSLVTNAVAAGVDTYR